MKVTESQLEKLKKTRKLRSLSYFSRIESTSSFKQNKRPKHNRSVYVIGFPVPRLVFARRSALSAHQNQLVLYRPGFAAKAAGQKPLRGAACPGSRRGPPPGVTVFANARINKLTSYPCIAPRVQKHAPPRLCANVTYRRTLPFIVKKTKQTTE